MLHCHKLLHVLLFLTTITHATKTVNICATPESGFWTAKPLFGGDGGPTAKQLHDEITKSDQKKITFAGVQHGEFWRLGGLYGFLVPQVMRRAKINNYTVTFYPTYTRALYETTKTKTCDVGFTPFTSYPDRAWCSASPSPTGSTCTNPLPGEPIGPQHACCASFGPPVNPMTEALLVSTELEPASIVFAILNIDVLNVTTAMLLAIVVVAHLVWFAERKINPQQFPPNYLDGIDDAIWWSCTTVTTVGYGDKTPLSNIGRMLAIFWMFGGITFIGLFAGTISSSVESATASRSITHISELTQKDTVCTPSTTIAKNTVSKTFSIYVSKDQTYESCAVDLVSGKATGQAMFSHLFFSFFLFARL
jgi:hypothetical protein